MPISLGTTTITALFLGTTSIASAYLGATQVFGGSFTPLSLFSGGAQGVWYDPSDLTTMFSDRAGTTPVTAPGQLVGLRLDKSKGLVLGAELVTNGDFAAGSTGWTVGAGWTVTGGEAVLNSTNVNQQISQSYTFTAGRTYRVQFTINSVPTNNGRISVTDNVAIPFASPVGQAGTFSFYFVAAAGSNLIGFRITNTTTSQTSIDNISVRELPGQHATQSITAALAAYRSGPARVDYDAVDDFHRVVFPAMSNATIAYSSPSVGATILTGQTIAAGNFDWNTDDCGLIIIDRPLTTAETIEVTAYLNAKAV